MRLSLSLFYLLILFLPTQLSRHFFWDSTTISGIRSDYLTPTIYFTDIIALVLIIGSNWSFWGRLRAKREGGLRNDNKYVFLLSVVCYLLFNVIFIATNQWAAFYKLIKILEFIFLGISLFRLKPKPAAIANLLSITVLYSSIIAIWQFLIQRSIGGVFWWLGERTFYASTPGIAAFTYKGSLLLRPYATFPHPNVLGGFLSVVLPFICYYLHNSWKKQINLVKVLYIFILIFGLTSLVLTFSRTSWLVAGIGFFLLIADRIWSFIRKNSIPKKMMLSILYFMITLSVLIPIFLPQTFLVKNQYWQERVILLKAAIAMISQNLIFGVGLNNSIVHLKEFINYIPGLFIFQPIHNVFLLILSEVGLVGFGIFLWGGIKVFSKISKPHVIFFVTLIQLFLLGLFDHYLYTLQQGQLLLTIFVALSRI